MRKAGLSGEEELRLLLVCIKWAAAMWFLLAIFSYPLATFYLESAFLHNMDVEKLLAFITLISLAASTSVSAVVGFFAAKESLRRLKVSKYLVAGAVSAIGLFFYRVHLSLVQGEGVYLQGILLVVAAALFGARLAKPR